jgi:hypothetical protein
MTRHEPQGMQKGPEMEMKSFDALTRQLSEAGPSRRLVTRTLVGALLGGAWAGVTAHFGLADPAAAKPSNHKAKAKSKHKSHAQRQADGQPHPEGKKGKGKKRHKKSPPSPLPPLPPGCEHCNECQMCQDGACVPDTSQGGVPCQGSGALCNYCLNGVCTATEQHPCDDGVCVHRGQCCPGQRKCDDLGMPEGFYCIPETNCCPGLKRCPNGACVIVEACCPGERK